MSELCERILNAEDCGCKAVRASFHNSLVSCTWPPQAKFMLHQLDAARVTGRKESTCPGESQASRERAFVQWTPHSLFFCLDVSQRSDFAQFSAHLGSTSLLCSCSISNCGWAASRTISVKEMQNQDWMWVTSPSWLFCLCCSFVQTWEGSGSKSGFYLQFTSRMCCDLQQSIVVDGRLVTPPNWSLLLHSQRYEGDSYKNTSTSSSSVT